MQHPTRTRFQSAPKKPTSSWSSEDDPILVALVGSTPKPDCNLIARHFVNKTAQQVADRWNKVVNPGLIKGSWTEDEDQQIIQWVAENGARNWTALAANLHGRLGKQRRER
jgi:hypothetical protein